MDYAAIICSLFACIGTIVVAYINYRSNSKSTREKRLSEQIEAQNKANKEHEEVVSKLLQDGIASLNSKINEIDNKVDSQGKSLKPLTRGMQALLRDRLLQEAKAANDLGFATLEQKQNFENMYLQYHNLGSNGVMDVVRDKYLSLPINSTKISQK